MTRPRPKSDPKLAKSDQMRPGNEQRWPEVSQIQPNLDHLGRRNKDSLGTLIEQRSVVCKSTLHSCDSCVRSQPRRGRQCEEPQPLSPPGPAQADCKAGSSYAAPRCGNNSGRSSLRGKMSLMLSWGGVVSPREEKRKVAPANALPPPSVRPFVAYARRSRG